MKATSYSSKDAERHAKKMRKIKAARDKMMENKTEKKGLIIVNTGAGKGKSSSGFGMILRCIGNDMQSAVVQFIKGSWMTGERKILREKFSSQVQFVVSGEGFTWETQDKDRDIAAAQAGWAKAKSFILDPTIDFVFCLLYTSPSPRDRTRSRMPSSA